MTLNSTGFAPALKEMYPDDVLKDMTIEDHALLAMIPKDENAYGNPIVVPVIYGKPQGRSASLSTAITNSGNTALKQFDLTMASDYAIAEIDRLTALRSENDEGAFAKAIETEMDGAVSVCAQSLARALYGDGHGHIGQIGAASVANPMVLTLLDINDIVNFEIGMVIEADDTEAGSSLRTTPATATLAGIDRDLGTVTTGYDNSGGATNWAANDYLYQDGDESAMLSGLAAWVPSTAPGATTFFGVDRTADVTRLGGVRVTGTGLPVESALLKLASKVSREKGKPRWAFVNDVAYYELITSLGSKVSFVEQAVTADVYFSGVRIHGPKGVLDVFPDFECPSQRAYVLTPESLKLYSVNPAPHIFDEDNDQKLLRAATADTYQARIGYYAQLGMSAPGWNGVVTLDAFTFA